MASRVRVRVWGKVRGERGQRVEGEPLNHHGEPGSERMGRGRRGSSVATAMVSLQREDDDDFADTPCLPFLFCF